MPASAINDHNSYDAPQELVLKSPVNVDAFLRYLLSGEPIHNRLLGQGKWHHKYNCTQIAADEPGVVVHPGNAKLG